jgi:hypothetical protein
MGGDTITVGLSYTQNATVAANSVTRLDGKNWIDEGYAVGQTIQIAGVSETRKITSLAAT